MVRVNGEEQEFRPGMTVAGLLEEKKYRTDRVAVERNGEIVPKKSYGQTKLLDGDTVEVVSFVGGG